MLQVAAALLAASVSGVVLDPQDLAIRDARVEIACGDRVQAATTDQHGSFAIPVRSDGPCVLSITRDGFAPFREPLDQQRRDPLVVRLQIAPVQHRVDVIALQPPHAPTTFGSILLSADRQSLRAFGATAADVIRYAQLVAGTGTRRAEVLVDGLPSSGLPPLDAIAHISIHGDPFSAEYADADVSSIEIITKAPSRKVRFFMGGDMPGVDARDMLSPALKSRSRFVNLGLMGPVPHVPLTFSASGSVSRSSQEMPIHVGPFDLGDRARSDTTVNRHGSASFGLHYAPRPSLRIRGSFRESRARSANAGIGGVTLREAGVSVSHTARDSRVTATHISPRFLYEGGAAATSNESQSRANSTHPGITVGGDVVMGGAPVSDSDRTATRWTLRHVVRSTSLRAWTIGAVIAGVREVNANTPNRGGTFYFPDVQAYRNALAGLPTGTWSVSRGSHAVQFASHTASGFAQAELVRRGEFLLSGGLRADYQSALGIVASPRLSLASRWRNVNVRAGAGLFVQRVPERVFLSVLENDGVYLQQFVASSVPLFEPADATLSAITSIRSRLADDLASPRSRHGRISAERVFGALTSALEYDVSDERQMLGSHRVDSGSGWMDVFASDRSATRHRLHAYVRYSRKAQQLVADYEFTRARDNTDGPFSFPAMPGHLEREWARSGGVPPHTLTVMGMFALPAEISLNVTDTWRSRSPYNVTTGRDLVGNGLFLDRGGRARNSGDGPRFHSLSLYAQRRVELSDFVPAVRGTGIDISVQADNVLNNRNVFGIGSVAGSTAFGQPLAAYPGRSVRVMFSVN